ncbi:unnamed protein product [Lampetra planeri]
MEGDERSAKLARRGAEARRQKRTLTSGSRDGAEASMGDAGEWHRGARGSLWTATGGAAPSELEPLERRWEPEGASLGAAGRRVNSSREGSEQQRQEPRAPPPTARPPTTPGNDVMRHNNPDVVSRRPQHGGARVWWETLRRSANPETLPPPQGTGEPRLDGGYGETRQGTRGD